jgi:hypothetical protein
MRFATITLAFGLTLASVPLIAADSSAPSHALGRRQLADCMTKRMAADRTISYNDAAKACKDELQGSKTDAALSKAPKPVS